MTAYFPPDAHRIFQNDVQGVLALRDNMEKRACNLAVYIIENRTTIRAAAKHFGVSKSTVHTEVDLCVEFLWSMNSLGVHDI